MAGVGPIAEGMAAELIRVEPGGCSAPRASDRVPGLLVVVEGTGAALAGDVWLEVGPGDRIEVDPGEPCAVRADRTSADPLVAVFVGHLRSPSQAA